MPVSDELLEILCCPVTRVALVRLRPERVQALNAAVAAGRLRYVDGALVEKPLDEALATEDGRRAYRVDDGIPVLLPDLGIDIREE